MSWHYSAKGEDKDSLEKDLEIQMPVAKLEAEQDQMATAQEIVLTAIKSGDFGNGPYTVVLSGHGKRGNSDLQGNTLSVSIHSKT